MTPALSSLAQRIAAKLSSSQQDDNFLRNDFHALTSAGLDMEKRLDKAEKIPPPPQEMRLAALRRFRLAEELTEREWRMVFYGLADTDPLYPDRPVLLEDDIFFPHVDSAIKKQIESKALKRKDWAALCSSYFAYKHESPETNPHWCVLRGHIARGYPVVKAAIRREKSWMKTIEFYHDIFTPQAGGVISQQLLSGESNALSSLEKIAQIPDSSWLWKRIFTVLLAQLDTLDDPHYLDKISWLLGLAAQWVRFRDDIMTATLTRYYHSIYRDQVHSALKQAALEYWDNPQLKSQQNKWHQYVSEPVAAMVRGWLAKQDLMHFFELLRGNGDVDQARLHYWLRFANQMGFTRIVMGPDACHDRGSDFVKFREENRGRLSHLRGGRSFDNAMIMQINDYIFVEFSGTGNAMYAYRVGQAPFNPESHTLDINIQLKDKYRNVLRLPHTPRAEGYNKTRITGWMLKYDDELRQLGIRWMAEEPVKFIDKKAPSTASVSDIKIINPLRDTAIQRLVENTACIVSDNRQKGGVLSVQLKSPDDTTERELLRLGFTPVTKEPHRYWIK
ncbi:EH signature domain-containing protein [Enterobacteriaceae bacterium H4N4]|uniref:EH signature domain-containing protein n=1 Tax=Silvania confinis TaxID=2926470 RepID=A0A9J6QC28_9ENTR|nr:type I Zorya anti-phage system protein ZorC [Silvania confinis]MCU6667811.1 EH signature domain-containing protein [Silvania confinis]